MATGFIPARPSAHWYKQGGERHQFAADEDRTPARLDMSQVQKLL
jgi:hypothetical protein